MITKWTNKMNKKNNDSVFARRIQKIVLLVLAMALWSCGPLSFKDLRKAEKGYKEGKLTNLDIILKIAATSKDTSLAREAVKTLGRLEGRRIVPSLVGFSANDKLRSESLRQLAERKEQGISSKLIEAHESSPTPLLLETLGHLRDSVSLPFLTKLINDPDLGPFALSAVHKIGGRGAQAAYRKIALDRKNSILKRQEALGLLKLISYSLNVKAVRDILYEPNLSLELLKTIKDMIIKEPLIDFLEPVKKLYKEKKGETKFQQVLLEIFAILNQLPKNLARNILEPPKKKVRPKKKKPAIFTGSSSKRIERIFQRQVKSSANDLGIRWTPKKSKNLFARVDGSLKSMAQNNRGRFQNLYKIYRARYPEKDFQEIQKMISRGMARGEAFDLLMLDAIKRYPSEAYRVVYVSKFLSISKVEAKVLLRSYLKRQ